MTEHGHGIDESLELSVDDVPGDVDDETDARMRDLQFEQEMGESYEDASKSQGPLKRKIYDLAYHPATELVIFFLVIVSIALLVIEVATPKSGPVGWMGGLSAGEISGGFFWADVAISSLFAVEYSVKLWVAPRKWYFIRRNWVDLLAILPVLRVLRIGRAVRLLRLFRMLRMVRVGRILSNRLRSVQDEVYQHSAENAVVIIYILFSIIFGTVGVMVFEKGAGSGFETLGDALWWCIVTLTTVGYGDLYPQTTGGKLVAGVLMFIGLSFYALMTGFLSTVLIERAKRETERGMDLLGLTNHVIICGWNQNGTRLIKDLHGANPRQDIVVLTERSDIPRILDDAVHYVTADPTTQEGLEKAQLHSADVVVVLSDRSNERSPQDADARAILTVLAVERIRPAVHSIVELNFEENLYHVQNAGVDEIIISESYTGTMLSQAVQNPGMSGAFKDLFEPGSGSAMFFRPLQDGYVGETFERVARDIRSRRGAILIGYRRAGAVDLAPAEDITFRQGDNLIVLGEIEDGR
jgi:voltage-gated potassium channel